MGGYSFPQSGPGGGGSGLGAGIYGAGLDGAFAPAAGSTTTLPDDDNLREYTSITTSGGSILQCFAGDAYIHVSVSGTASGITIRGDRTTPVAGGPSNGQGGNGGDGGFGAGFAFAFIRDAVSVNVQGCGSAGTDGGDAVAATASVAGNSGTGASALFYAGGVNYAITQPQGGTTGQQNTVPLAGATKGSLTAGTQNTLRKTCFLWRQFLSIQGLWNPTTITGDFRFWRAGGGGSGGAGRSVAGGAGANTLRGGTGGGGGVGILANGGDSGSVFGEANANINAQCSGGGGGGGGLAVSCTLAGSEITTTATGGTGGTAGASAGTSPSSAGSNGSDGYAFALTGRYEA